MKDDVPLYIGQSAQISARVATHRRTKKWYGQVTHVLTRRVARGEDRLLMETLLILRYRPRYNRLIRVQLRSDGSIYETAFLEKVPPKRPKRKEL